MCLAIPSKIIEIDNFRAMVDVYGARREINLMLMPEEVGIGDYVLVHAGFAIQKVEHESAHEALKVISAILEDAGKDIEAGDEGSEFYG
jgi:hydrogenase expression/formation protein HypC